MFLFAYFYFAFFGSTTLNGAQELLLALHLKINSGSAQGTNWDATDQIHVDCRQGKVQLKILSL